MSERFYINCPLAAGEAVLEGEEARHLAAVCRLRPGDPLALFNGDGCEYPARVRTIERQRVTLEVLEPTHPRRELHCSLTVACPLPKGDRAQFLLEKLTELGVSRFVPLATERRALQPREIRPDRLRRHVVEASKQCGRNVLLQVEPATTWDDFCRRGDMPELRVLGHPGGSPLAEVWQSFHEATALALAVGPEGGFTDEEIKLAEARGWKLIDLGTRILRVETAAIFLASAVIVAKNIQQELSP